VPDEPNLPKYEYIRVPPSDNSSVATRGDTLRFAMVPWEVGTDPRLSAEDVRVYFALAASRRGPDVTIGMRFIAKACCRGYRKIGKSIARLQKFGHLELACPGKRGSRSRYRLTSALFGSGAQHSDSTKQAPYSDTKQASEVAGQLLRCPKCNKRCKQILHVGWCRTCQWKVNVDRRAEVVARRVMREKMAS
jgi:hypothetical protein